MRITSILLSLSALALFGIGAAHASTNLVKNGTFEATTNGTNKQVHKDTTRTDRTTVSDWRSYNGNDGGYNFVLDTGIITTGASAIALKSYASTVDHGNVFVSDSQYWPGVLSQTIGGLTVGGLYTLSFDYAMGQQAGFNGTNLDNYWAVTFGNSTQNSGKLSSTDGSFSGWNTATMNFTASSASQVLSFLVKGTAPGAPPFMLLDNVSLVSAVPEPSTWAMLLGGLGLVGFVARRRAARLA